MNSNIMSVLKTFGKNTYDKKKYQAIYSAVYKYFIFFYNRETCLLRVSSSCILSQENQTQEYYDKTHLK